MFSLLLPLNTDAGRRLAANDMPPRGSWRDLFHDYCAIVATLLALNRK
jgi:hypothetical protein